MPRRFSVVYLQKLQLSCTPGNYKYALPGLASIQQSALLTMADCATET